MATKSFRPSKRGTHKPARDVDAVIREAAQKRTASYRERSLAIHGWICAK